MKTQISLKGQTDKQNVIYIYNGILFRLKKEILQHAII
jgi:hypothetical protein